MKRTLMVINELEAAGLIQRYAIGGAIAALFYMEPFETEDLDILILLPPELNRSLTPLANIYEELKRRGYREEDVLIEESVEHASEVIYSDVPTRVPAVEYLAAIMLQTGRSQDRTRFTQLREQVDLDLARLQEILNRYNLMERYRQWTAA
jgi:hypothetical protein